MRVDKFNALLCPIPGCDASLRVIWETAADLHAEGGFCNRGYDETDQYSPQGAATSFWKVECGEGQHVVLTAHDEFPGCWEMHDREEVQYSDEDGWEFSIDRVRQHLARFDGLVPA